MDQSGQNNRIDYIELPVDAVGTAKKFYGQVFAWSFTDFGPEYASFDDGRLTGGFNADRGKNSLRSSSSIRAISKLRAMPS